MSLLSRVTLFMLTNVPGQEECAANTQRNGLYPNIICGIANSELRKRCNSLDWRVRD